MRQRGHQRGKSRASETHHQRHRVALDHVAETGSPAGRTDAMRYAPASRRTKRRHERSHRQLDRSHRPTSERATTRRQRSRPPSGEAPTRTSGETSSEQRAGRGERPDRSGPCVDGRGEGAEQLAGPARPIDAPSRGAKGRNRPRITITTIIGRSAAGAAAGAQRRPLHLARTARRDRARPRTPPGAPREPTAASQVGFLVVPRE